LEAGTCPKTTSLRCYVLIPRERTCPNGFESQASASNSLGPSSSAFAIEPLSWSNSVMSISAQQFADSLRLWAAHRYAQADEVLTEGADRVFESIAENFSRKEDASGKPWPAHSPMTVQLHGVHPLLVLSGAMRQAASGSSGSIRKWSKQQGRQSLGLGISISKIPYYPAHQYGQGRIPRRQFFYVSRRDSKQLVEFLRRRLIGHTRKRLRWR
jgi:hypothetical protein